MLTSNPRVLHLPSPNNVIGGEADIQGANITSEAGTSGAPGFFDGTSSSADTTFIAKQTIHILGTVRARVGYTGFDRLMVYGTGGLAYAQARLSNTFSVQNVGTFAAYKNVLKAGWVGGAGVEYALDDHVSVKGEALYYDAGSTMIRTQTISPDQHAVKFDTRGTIFRIGVNYAFATPEEPSAAPVVSPPAPALPLRTTVAPEDQMFLVLFQFDKSNLSFEGQRVVDSAAVAFKVGRSGVAVAGYTDLVGTQQYNLALSKRRADTVKAALIKDGIAASAIDESWHGKENPRVPTPDGTREPQNRRVEITM